MNIAAALALQSIPFALLFLMSGASNRDIFCIGYAAALGLILSLIAFVDGHPAFPHVFAAAYTPR
ncbi:hypothetical protein [Methylobacterium gnaphalii]|uniref:Uncharacterized protein n=1 Tax=Methylobacterium gnaphalii TaxID=1010610 RepID=A0A512JQ54_9HYPH|nr:hypothetical protein [Methylobacterium gnaphalii]GEP12094.1 hypothetical protein MGN01_39390 [Methylobacterium gnaphalii]GJD71014.1 hypothetical protein MMMDOFMJ_3968 [Methylobacterium gnaphalii]GLS48211.1 hypothetical protein GCM10007885_10550 [Methylobacterium gnaphalii]